MKNKGLIIGLWITVGITFLATLAALVVFIVTTNTYQTQLENLYKRSFYELSSNINDLEVDMSKLVAVNDTTTKREVLTNIYNSCTMANNNISNLPISNNKIEKVNAFINTLGGYTYSLLTKVNDNVDFSDYDYEKIEELHTASLNLKAEYNSYISTLKFDYNIINDVDFSSGDNSSFNAGFVNLENSKVPTLIYDGPFSDSVLNKEVKGLPNYEVSKEDAEQIVKEKLAFLEVKNTSLAGESDGEFYTYNFNVETQNSKLFVQVTKQGGVLLDITGYGTGGTENLSSNQAITLAETFATNLGYENMHQVWYAENKNIMYVNLAPIVGGIIYYPDLVKVKVDKTMGQVIALEGKNYCYNHVERSLNSPKITFDDAQSKLSKALSVKERNLTLIPNKFVGETLTYEFICTWKDYTYYVYIDVETGEEVNILRIIKTTSGDLII